MASEFDDLPQSHFVEQGGRHTPETVHGHFVLGEPHAADGHKHGLQSNGFCGRADGWK